MYFMSVLWGTEQLGSKRKPILYYTLSTVNRNKRLNLRLALVLFYGENDEHSLRAFWATLYFNIKKAYRLLILKSGEQVQF